jgi:hypothetical protein
MKFMIKHRLLKNEHGVRELVLKNPFHKQFPTIFSLLQNRTTLLGFPEIPYELPFHEVLDLGTWTLGIKIP